MKMTIATCSAVILLLTAIQSRAGILAGPIANPDNGHEYYLLTPNTWTASEAEAEQLGGTLAVVKSAADQEWVFSKFGDYAGTNRNLWIGLHRQWQGGPFAWVTDIKLDYVNWSDGEPNNRGGVENCVHINSPVKPYTTAIPGKWNDLPDAGTLDDGSVPFGVVEVPGRSHEAALTEQEKAMIGSWYNNGDPDQPCWIAGTDNLLFAIDQNKDASRAVYTTEGLLFSPKWKQHAEIVKDKILWSRGNWWSRKPAEYKSEETSSDRNAPRASSGSMTDETAK